MKKTKISFSRRIIRGWALGALVPLVLTELLFLAVIVRMNRRDTDAMMEYELHKISENMNLLMTGMNTMSYLLMADGTVGRDLYLYFEEEDSQKKGDLLIYLQEQIAHYEVANPSIGNITYVFVPNGPGEATKINKTSLASGELPKDEHILCRKSQVTYYGPHRSRSRVASYPCLSLLRTYKEGMDYGDVYIYLESGFRYLESILPSRVQGIQALFRIESESGETLYSTNEEVFPLYKILEDPAALSRGGRFRLYEIPQEGGWKLQMWMPMGEYYNHIRDLALNFCLFTLLTAGICILISLWQWRSIYFPFMKFEQNLQKIGEADTQTVPEICRMDIQEFDDQFALLGRLRGDILRLLEKIRQEEKRYYELELKTISGRMNPHFLYNTLDTLRWFAARKKDREMVHFITSLNRLLFYNMSRRVKTTLKSELDAVSAYIVLQKLKYDLDFHIDGGRHPELLCADMPRFCLQPLVENAILHSGSNQVRIWIEVELLVNGKIAIMVKNEGKPIDPEKIKELLSREKSSPEGGIGLPFVARMLENRFGGQFELRTERLPEGINLVEIRIPFEIAEAAGGGEEPAAGEEIRDHDSGIYR